jgi:hypothetical protein
MDVLLAVSGFTRQSIEVYCATMAGEFQRERVLFRLFRAPEEVFL